MGCIFSHAVQYSSGLALESADEINLDFGDYAEPTEFTRWSEAATKKTLMRVEQIGGLFK